MTADREPGIRVVEILEGRIAGLQEEVAKGFELCATRVLVDEIAYRLELAQARILQLETEVTHLRHPSTGKAKR